MNKFTDTPYLNGEVDEKTLQLRYEVSIMNKDARLFRSLYKKKEIMPNMNNIQEIRNISKLEKSSEGKFTRLLCELEEDKE